jgi:hypothetical protein
MRIGPQAALTTLGSAGGARAHLKGWGANSDRGRASVAAWGCTRSARRQTEGRRPNGASCHLRERAVVALQAYVRGPNPTAVLVDKPPERIEWRTTHEACVSAVAHGHE